MSTPSPLWYASRGLGIVLLLFLTTSVVLGILTFRRWQPAQEARFVTNGLHRNVALVSVLLLALHGISNVLDPFAGLHLQDLLVPFVASYRPLWVGLGVLAGDLLLAIVATSLIRVRLGFRVWRWIHWLTYAAWPFGFLHGLGTGTDTRSGWALFLYAVCLIAVVIAVLVRLFEAQLRPATKTLGTLTLAAAMVGVVFFTFLGPMQSGWARLAGTPTNLLGNSHPAVASPTPTPVTHHEGRH